MLSPWIITLNVYPLLTRDPPRDRLFKVVPLILTKKYAPFRRTSSLQSLASLYLADVTLFRSPLSPSVAPPPSLCAQRCTVCIPQVWTRAEFSPFSPYPLPYPALPFLSTSKRRRNWTTAKSDPCSTRKACPFPPSRPWPPSYPDHPRHTSSFQMGTLFVPVLSIYPAISWPSFALPFILFADFRRRDQPTVDKLLFTPPNMTFLWRGYRLLLTIFSWRSSPRRTQRVMHRALARFDEQREERLSLDLRRENLILWWLSRELRRLTRLIVPRILLK